MLKKEVIGLRRVEQEFLDLYIRTNKFCEDMFRSQNGISTYLEEMERVSSSRSYLVDDWNADYRMLKRLRWLRNQIAHEGFSECNEDDYMMLEQFQQRLYNRQDPLALLYQREQEIVRRRQEAEAQRRRNAQNQRQWDKIQAEKHAASQNQPQPPREHYDPATESKAWIWAIVGIAVVITIIFVWISLKT